MKLDDFLKVLKTQDVQVTVKKDGTDVIKFFSQGYEGVESDIRDIAVTGIDFIAPRNIEVTLQGSETNTEPDENTGD